MSTQAATENGQKSKYRTVKKKSQWKTIWIRFKRNKLAVAGLVVFLIMAVIVFECRPVAGLRKWSNHNGSC